MHVCIYKAISLGYKGNYKTVFYKGDTVKFSRCYFLSLAHLENKSYNVNSHYIATWGSFR